MNILEVNEVTKQYVNHKALDSVSLAVPEGMVFGLLGPNGAGKTTLIRIINQITAPDSGSVYFKGRQLKPDDVTRIGYLPEERGLYKKMKVGEQAIYLARLKGLSKNEAAHRLKFWFAKFDMSHWWDKKVEELSKGMQQKVQFIVTILHEPELLIFDEPFSGFDPINANLLKEEILTLKKKGATIIFSTHNMASVEEICDNIALINKSKKILDGQVDDIRQQFKANLFEITYTGNFDTTNQLINTMVLVAEHRQNHKANYIKGELKPGYTYNSLLQMLLPEIHITRFNEILPGMDDIFIKVVKNAE